MERHSDDDLNSRDIMVTCGEKQTLISSEDLFNFTYTYEQNDNLYMQMSSSKSEQTICSAIETVVSEQSDEIVFLLGNNEHEYYLEFADLLENKGHDISFVNVYEQEIPDVKLAVLFAPADDFTDTSMLQEFLYNEGAYSRNLLYVANSSNDVMDNLDAFFEKWGIAIET